MSGLSFRSMANGFNPVAKGIIEEGAEVVVVIVQTEARGTIILAAVS